MDKLKNYNLLKKIINEEDPLGLIDFDTPESLNEYDPELREIFKKDISCLDDVELGQWIYQVFVLFFNKELAGKKEKYDLIANRFINSAQDKI